jgi:ABC-2 type transport system permease protein
MTAPQVPAAGPAAGAAARAGGPAGRPDVPAAVVRALGMLSSEWTKLRSLRSNRWTLLAVAIITIGSAALVGAALATGPPPPSGGPVTALTESFLGYAEYAVLPAGVLGILAFSSEYATGLIAVTYAAEPRRWAVLAAKAAVVAAAALIAGVVLACTSFLLTQAVLSGHHRGLSLAQPGVAGAVLAAGLLLCVSALTGLGLGAIVRHVAGAVAALVGLVYLLGLACLFLPSPWADRAGRFTIALAAYQVVALHPQRDLLSPAWSMLVLLAWPAAVLLAAGLVITRRDA